MPKIGSSDKSPHRPVAERPASEGLSLNPHRIRSRKRPSRRDRMNGPNANWARRNEVAAKAVYSEGRAVFAQERPLDNIASRQNQHEIRPLRLALDRWLHVMGLQDFGLSIRLVKASDLPPNACWMSNYNVRSVIGEIDVS